MLRKCHGHGLTKGAIIQIFYHGLDEPTQGILDITAGGIFLYKSPSQAFQFLEDKVLFNLDCLKEELQDMRNKYNELREGNASKNHMNDDTPMCKRHEVKLHQSEEYQNRNSHDSYSHQSYHDPNDSEKSLTELNNDVKNDLEDFKRCIRSMRTVHDKLFDRDDGKTTGVLPNKKSKPINQEPQSKTDFEKLMTKFLDDQRVTKDTEIESFKSLAQHSVNKFVVINIPEEDVETKQIILDPDDQPMWENAKIVTSTPNSPIIQLDVDDNFVINSTQENKFDGYLRADPHDHIREFLAICNMFRYGETHSEAVNLLIFPFSLCDKTKTWFNELNEESITSWEQMRKAFINRFFPPSLFNCLLLKIRNFSLLAMDSQIISLNKELQDIRNKYNELREGNASKNNLNDDPLLCEPHYIQSEEYQNQNSYDSYSHQSYHDPNDSEKSLTELNNDVKNDLEDFERYVHSMRTIHDKLFDRDDGKTTDSFKYVCNYNVNDMIIKMKQNEKNFQTIFKHMERKMDEWEKSQNISLEQTDRTESPPPPPAQTEHMNVVFTGSGKSDYSLKIQKDPPPPIIVNNKSEKDRPIKTSKKGYHVVKTKEYPFH
ncbi:reverse transcriptase domain-containing protein [Tanacetum coccineum]